jgi:5-phospho-D-xylono-1,4-lactonase
MGMQMIRTICGDIRPEDLGPTYMHEHLIIDSPIVRTQFPHISLPGISEAVEECSTAHRAGVGAMVDCMPHLSGGNFAKLKAVSEGSGMHIIASTGAHTRKYYDDELYQSFSHVENFSNRLTQEINDERAGIIKVATLGEEMDGIERAIFEGAALAHKATGVPILTHCENGLGAISQISVLNELGVSLNRVIISHTDKNPDVPYHRELLQAGVNLEYDQGLRQKDDPHKSSAKLLTQMASDGFIGQLMLGTDGARRSLWGALGGTPGLSWLYTGWSAILAEMGMTTSDLRQLFTVNPARFLSVGLRD